MRQLEKRFDWLRLCKLIIQTMISTGGKKIHLSINMRGIIICALVIRLFSHYILNVIKGSFNPSQSHCEISVIITFTLLDKRREH